MKRIPPNLQPSSRIYFLHIRYEDVNDPTTFDTHGGVTVAYRYLSDIHQWEVGIAQCNINDNFCKKLGRTIAINRLNWGDCHRLSLKYDDTQLKETTDEIRDYVNNKFGLVYTEPEPKIGLTNSLIH